MLRTKVQENQRSKEQKCGEAVILKTPGEEVSSEVADSERGNDQ